MQEDKNEKKNVCIEWSSIIYSIYKENTRVWTDFFPFEFFPSFKIFYFIRLIVLYPPVIWDTFGFAPCKKFLLDSVLVNIDSSGLPLSQVSHQNLWRGADVELFFIYIFFLTDTHENERATSFTNKKNEIF